jgi:ATP-dependent helicase/nuclease subunit A
MDDRMSEPAEGIERVPEDQAARSQILADLNQNMVVLAGAGAGKTRALVDRMVAVVAAGEDVRRVVGITFTRKAAGEMRSRFVRALRVATRESTGEEARRLEEALRQVDQAFVGTIHSFCSRILRERPLEAGLPPDFEELDEVDSGVLTRRYWEECLRHLEAEGEGDAAPLTRLQTLGIRPEELFSFFRFRVGNGDVALKEPSDVEPDLSAAIAQVDAVLASIPEIPVGATPDPDRFLDYVDRARRFRRYHGVASEADRAVLLRLYLKAVSGGKSAVTLYKWGDARDLARHVRDHVAPDMKERILEPALTAWRERAYSDVVPIVETLVRQFEEYRRKAGLVTFYDLLFRTAKLLRDRPAMRQFFARKYRRFFVDEFQDTDPLQAEMLFYLVGEDENVKDWRDAVPQAGRLFIVGDEKQSIYRFRRADVDTFRLVRRRIVETGGREVYLDTSFRTLGNLCEWLNASFQPLFESQEGRYQARFARLLQYREEGPDPTCVRKITIPADGTPKRSEIAEREADRVADFIAAAVDGQASSAELENSLLPDHCTASAFMILARQKRNLSVYARALESRGIPYDIAGGERLGLAREVQALQQLLEALYAPRNPVPLLACLRGPLVGAGDDELYRYHKAGGQFRVLAPVPEGLEAPVRGRFEQAYALFDEALRDLEGFSPAVALERIIDRTGLQAYAAALPRGSTRSGSLTRLMSLVRSWEREGKNWGHVMREMRALVNEDEYLVEQMTLEAGEENVVRIMTVHQAKGLEADVVFLVDVGDSQLRRRSPDQHVSRTASEPYLSMPVVSMSGEFRSEPVAIPPGWEADSAEETEYQKGEELRLMYVAATRARDLLVVSTHERSRGKATWSPLFEALSEVRELAVPAVSRRSSPRASSVPSQIMTEEEAGDRWKALGRIGFAVSTVTGDAPDADISELPAGRGADYGTLVHLLVESAIERRLPRDERGYAKALAAGLGLAGEASRAIEDLERFRRSVVWEEMSRAPERYAEVPYGIPEGDGGIRGKIDLVYRGPNGWKIVDFKTQQAETHRDRRKLAEHYRSQVEAYARHWERIAGDDVSDAGIFLTASGDYVSIVGAAPEQTN